MVRAANLSANRKCEAAQRLFCRVVRHWPMSVVAGSSVTWQPATVASISAIPLTPAIGRAHAPAEVIGAGVAGVASGESPCMDVRLPAERSVCAGDALAVAAKPSAANPTVAAIPRVVANVFHDRLHCGPAVIRRTTTEGECWAIAEALHANCRLRSQVRAGRGSATAGRVGRHTVLGDHLRRRRGDDRRSGRGAAAGRVRSLTHGLVYRIAPQPR